MDKRLIYIIGGTIFILVLSFTLVLVHDNSLSRRENLSPPNRINSYPVIGYYKIDPETILTSLEHGNTDVFLALPEDPQNITEDVTNITINWTQADFLRISNALSRFLWNDPMDPKDWNVYFISLRGSCSDPVGFFSAVIAYFRTERTTYTTRLIEINPYLGFVRWGDQATYPRPIFQKWNSVDLFGVKFSADDALRIASEDAKKRFHFKDNCGLLMSTPQNNDPKNWYLHVFGSPDSIVYIVNLETGDYSLQMPSR